MGLFSRNKPKIKVQTIKKDGFSGWIKCSGCQELIHSTEMQSQLFCCPNCRYHYKMDSYKRIELLTDKNSFIPLFTHIQPTDPLGFIDQESYAKRLKAIQKKSGRDEAIIVGEAKILGREVALAVMDFSFMGGSMGSVVGEKLTRLIERACEKEYPLVVVCSSGGARMQESILSLMQMGKTSCALAKFHKKGLPYISILAHPTTGGVTASFASLGDVIIAEPNALIAFAGPRVVAQTIGQQLPPGAQKSEFLLEKGMIDAIVDRGELKDQVALFLEYMTVNRQRSVSQVILDEKFPESLKELLRIAQMQE